MDHRVAVVTGGSRGIGRAIALELARQGAIVVVNHLSAPAEAEDVIREIQKNGGRAVAFHADVSNRADVVTMIGAAVQNFGGIDILVNNAGIDTTGSILDITDVDWERVFAVNVRGCFFCTQAAARAMVENRRGGRIINISSINARLGWRARAAYSATKGAVEAFTRCCACDVGPYGITVNAIAPGPIRTEMWGDTLTPEVEAAHAQRLPLGYIGEPDDVAGITAFLASSAARFITGEVILVDGGRGRCDYLPVGS